MIRAHERGVLTDENCHATITRQWGEDVKSRYWFGVARKSLEAHSTYQHTKEI